MRKIAIFLVSLFVLFFNLTPNVQAASPCQGSKTGLGVILQSGVRSHTITITMDSGQYSFDQEYTFRIKNPKYEPGKPYLINSPSFQPGKSGTSSDGSIKVQSNTVTWIISEEEALASDPPRSLTVEMHKSGVSYNNLCDLGSYTTAKFSNPTTPGLKCEVYVYQERGGKKCYSTGCLTAGGITTYIEASGLKGTDGKPYTGDVEFRVKPQGAWFNVPFDQSAANGTVTAQYETKDVAVYSVELSVSDGIFVRPICDKFNFETHDECTENLCGERGNVYVQPPQPNFELCEQISNDEQRANCLDCFGEGAEGENPGVWTAIGCIPVEPTGIIQTLIRLGLGLGGGVTLLLILAGAFRLSVSQGDPKAAEEAKEQITSAVIGLLFIIFSIVMLRFIGVQMLQIPGFGG